MTNYVPVDPVCLDLPDHELCHGDPPPAPAQGGLEPSVCRFSSLPCVGLAVSVHALIFVLGMALAVSTELPKNVVSISLMSGLGDLRPPPGPGQSYGAPSEPGPQQTAQPVQDKRPEPEAEKSRPVKTKPVKPVSVARKEAAKAVEKIDPPANHVDETDEETMDAADTQSAMFMSGSGNVTTGPVATSVSGGAGSGGAVGWGGHTGGTGSVDARFGDAEGPRFINRVMPRYPELARRRGREGLVMLRLTIDSTGALRDAQIVEKAGFGFDEAALAAAGASTYSPARQAGRPVDCVSLLPIRFALKE